MRSRDSKAGRIARDGVMSNESLDDGATVVEPESLPMG